MSSQYFILVIWMSSSFYCILGVLNLLLLNSGPCLCAIKNVSISSVFIATLVLFSLQILCALQSRCQLSFRVCAVQFSFSHMRTPQGMVLDLDIRLFLNSFLCKVFAMQLRIVSMHAHIWDGPSNS